MSTYWTGLWIGLLEFRCYEVRIEESEKGQQPPGVKPRTPLAWATSALPLKYGNQTTTNPHTYCTGGTECLSHTLGSHSACAVRTPLGVDWKVLFIRKEPCWVVFLTLNVQSILLHAGKKCHFNKPFAIWVSGEWTYYMHGQLILWTDWLRI